MDSVREELTEACRQTAAALVAAAVVACTDHTAIAGSDSMRLDSLTRAQQDSVNRAQPGYVVDSIFSAGEESRRFNAGMARPAALAGSAASRGELVRLFSRALQRHDTAGLRAALITRAEFGYFVFPESPFAREPFKTKPGVIWMQLEAESARGITRLLERVAGHDVRLTDVRCDREPERQGRNTYWRDCSVLVSRGEAAPTRAQLFGHILERNGRVKFVSYASDF
ncbi:MAG: hypothetical protein ACT4P6_22045 [Gemmatimonadaceae bacterium]